jgi:signal transduction histidine kinase
VSLATEGDDVLVTVRDTGIGIPRAAVQQIFEPFMQLRGAQSSGGGLGLGLALVKRLTELHNGGVNVASAGEGAGSSFTVRLPALANERKAVDAESGTRK